MQNLTLKYSGQIDSNQGCRKFQAFSYVELAFLIFTQISKYFPLKTRQKNFNSKTLSNKNLRKCNNLPQFYPITTG